MSLEPSQARGAGLPIDRNDQAVTQPLNTGRTESRGIARPQLKVFDVPAAWTDRFLPLTGGIAIHAPGLLRADRLPRSIQVLPAG